jgi:predicted MFS family arabinose efflux permease
VRRRYRQRTWLAERLASERSQREAIRKFSLGEAFYDPKVWLLTLAYFGHNLTNYGLVFFMPLIVQGLGASPNMIGWISALPFVFGFASMLFWGWHRDHTGERTWHIAGPSLLCGVAMAVCIFIGVSHPVMVMIALILAAMSNQVITPVFWSLPSALLTGTAAAAGIALISAVGNLGGWLGPYMFGLVKDSSGSNNVALLCLAAGTIISGIAVVAAGHDPRMERMHPD